MLVATVGVKTCMNIGTKISAKLTLESAKRTAAFAAGRDHLFNNCRLGVGSGSTVKYLVEFLANSTRRGELKNIVCVPSSLQTRQWLIDADLSVSTLFESPILDVCIDGADEIDASLNCVKGGGGCLVREKIVQACAKRFCVIADITKQVSVLGDNFSYIPIEVIPFGYYPLIKRIETEVGGKCILRQSGKVSDPFITDNGNYILDWNFPKRVYFHGVDFVLLNNRLMGFPGVVGTGLFIDVVDQVYLATPEGHVTVQSREATSKVAERRLYEDANERCISTNILME